MHHFFGDSWHNDPILHLALNKHVWKSFASEPLFSYRSSIDLSGSFVLFHRKDMSQKNEVLFDRQQF
jgi:hypothetical protein